MSAQELITILGKFPPDTPITIMVGGWENQIVDEDVLVCDGDNEYPKRLVLDVENKANAEFYVPYEEWLEDTANG